MECLKMKYWLTVFLSVFAFWHVAFAQTVMWQMAPRNYDAVSRIGKDLFKVEKDGKYGLIKTDGYVVLDLKADNISPLYSGCALATVRENGKNVVLGVLSSYGDYHGFAKKYYTIAGQEFYSDGLITVSDERGRVGYLDDEGNAVLGFDGRFDNIKPFTEGYAAVFKNEAYSLINKRGVEADMIIGVGEVYGGTNVCNGIAYIWDTDGNMFTFDVRTGKCDKAREPFNNQPDYLYCYQGVSGRGAEPVFTEMAYTGINGPEPYVKDGFYGYSSGGFLLPPQFSSATTFVDGLAVVAVNGHIGILRYLENEQPFALSVPEQTISYRKGQSVTCPFRLQTPEAVKDGFVKVTVKNSSDVEMPVTVGDEGNYSFTLIPEDGATDFLFSVTADGLCLWEDRASYTFKKHLLPLVARISVAGHKADANDKIEVIATVSNPNDESLTAEVRITGSSCLVPKSATVTVPAKGNRQLNTVFVVKDTKAGQHATVSTTKGGSASTGSLTLEAFY